MDLDRVRFVGSLRALAIASALLLACGDDGASQTDASTSSTSAPASTGDDGGSISASSSPSGSGSATGTGDTTAGSDGDTTVGGSGSDTTAGPAGTCADWAPPPGECEPPGAAMASVTGDLLPELVDEPCQIGAITNVDATTDTVELDCGTNYALQITTAEPHLDLPFSVGQDVLVSATESFEPAISGLPSFVIRDTGGGILLAHVAELDHAPDVSLDPLPLAVVPSGCPGSDEAVICDADGSLLVQRAAVEIGVGPTVLFDGNQGIASADADYSVIVHRARTITCWDDDCAADDSGPFDELALLLVVLPSG